MSKSDAMPSTTRSRKPKRDRSVVAADILADSGSEKKGEEVSNEIPQTAHNQISESRNRQSARSAFNTRKEVKDKRVSFLMPQSLYDKAVKKQHELGSRSLNDFMNQLLEGFCNGEIDFVE